MLGCSCGWKGSNSSSKMLWKAFPSEGSVIIPLNLDWEVEEEHAGLTYLWWKMLRCVRACSTWFVGLRSPRTRAERGLASIALPPSPSPQHPSDQSRTGGSLWDGDRSSKRTVFRWWGSSATTNHDIKKVRLGQKCSHPKTSYTVCKGGCVGY